MKWQAEKLNVLSQIFLKRTKLFYYSQYEAKIQSLSVASSDGFHDVVAYNSGSDDFPPDR